MSLNRYDPMKEKRRTEMGSAQSDNTSLTLACRNGLQTHRNAHIKIRPDESGGGGRLAGASCTSS